MFKFNINSANSIVKNYDLNFKLPSGNIGNMYAIQASSGNTSEILPLTDRISQALSLSSLREDNKKDSSGITLLKKRLRPIILFLLIYREDASGLGLK